MKCFNVLRRIATVLAIALAGAVPSTARADTVTDWNAIMQATVTAPPTNPFFQARWGAIVQLAVFEAVNAIKGDYEPYLGIIDAPPWASPDAAAIAAAHRTLVTLRPGKAAALDAAADRLARGDPGRPGEGCRHCGRRGRRGRHASAPGQRWLGCRGALHAGNRSRRLAADAARVRAGLLPGWGQVTPFGLE